MILATVNQVVAIALVGAWTLVALHFARRWAKKKNPISLAICLTIVLIAYSDFLIFAAYRGLSLKVAGLIWKALQTVFCIGFHIAIRRSAQLVGEDEIWPSPKEHNDRDNGTPS